MSNLFRKKDVSQLLSGNTKKLSQTLSAFDLIMLGVGAIIGTGIFILPGTVAATHSGPAIVISFIIASIVCGLAAMCYAEFSSTIPVTGSAYTYGYIIYGEIVAWLVGWALVLEYGLASASVATGWSAYFINLLEGFNIYLPKMFTGPFDPANGTIINLPAVIIVLLIALLLTRGVQESTRVNKIMVFVKVGVILLFLLVGMFYVKPENWQPFMPFGLEGVLSASAIVIFAFLGFDAVSSAAEEVKNPQRNMPIGIIGSLFVCALLYIAVSLVLTGIVPYTQLNVTDSVSFALQMVNQNWVSGVISIGAVLGMMTVILVMIFGGSRLLYALGRDGLLPKVVYEVNPKNQTPVKGTWIFSIFIAFCAGFIPLGTLAELVNIGTLLAFIVVSIGVIFLRRMKDMPSGGFKVPLFPIIPILSFGACVFLILQLAISTWIACGIWFLIGLAIYFIYGRSHSTMNES